MADTLPINFPTPTENALISFSFTDSVTRTGYVSFYGIYAQGAEKSLIPSPIESALWRTSQAGTGATNATPTLKFEQNYDVTFNVPAIIGGKLFTSHTYGATTGGSAGTFSSYTKVRILHVTVGGTETLIGTQQTTDTLAVTNATGEHSLRRTCEFAITRRTFKVGEKLRVEIEYWCSDLSSSSYVGYLYHDGASRGDPGNEIAALGTNETDIRVIVPFIPQG